MKRAFRWLVVMSLALAGCLAPAAPPEPEASYAPDPLPDMSVPLPDLSGEWLVRPQADAPGEIWTIAQVGNTLTGTIVPDPATLPAGVTIPPRNLMGRFVAGIGDWNAAMDVPSGVLRLKGRFEFTFCPRPGGPTECMLGAKRIAKPVPRPTPS